MILRSSALVAALALAGNAFMIPSTMSLKGKGSEDLSSSFWGQSPAFRDVTARLDCTGCSWNEPDSNYQSKDETKSSLVFNFTLSHDSKAVLINGQRFFDDAYTLKPLTVPQIPSYASLTDLESQSHSAPVRHRQLSYSLTATEIDAADESNVKLVDARLVVKAVDNEAVNLNPIGLRMLKDEAGNMRIMDVTIIPQEEPADEFSILPIEGSMDNVQPHPQECPTDSSPRAIFCQLRSYMKQKLSGFRGHSKKPCSFRKHGGERGHHHFGPPQVKGGPNKFRPHLPNTDEKDSEVFQQGHHSHIRPHHGPHGHHGPHAHRFCLRKALRYARHVVVALFFPVMAALTVGMLGGLFVVMVFWAFMRLLGVRRYVTVAEAREEEDDDGEDEKFALLSSLEDQTVVKDGVSELESPPAYIEKATQ